MPVASRGAVRLLPWVLTAAVFIGGLGTIVLYTAMLSVRAFGRTLTSEITIEVPSDTSPARLETVQALLRQTHGVRSVTTVDAAETARLLAPWLGPSPKLDELPVPKLIDVQVDPAQAIDLTTLRKQLTSAAPEAQVDDHLDWSARLRASARRIDVIAGAAIAGAVIIAMVAGIIAAVAAIETDRPLIATAHLLGAGDADLIRPLALRALWLGSAGGAGGAVAIIAAAFALDGVGSVLRLPLPPGLGGIGNWRLWATAAGSTLIAGGIAAVCAYATARRRVAALP